MGKKILSDVLITNAGAKRARVVRYREHMPSVLTSEEWLEKAAKKEKDKEELLKEKEKRKQLQQLNIKKKEEKMLKANKKAKSTVKKSVKKAKKEEIPTGIEKNQAEKTQKEMENVETIEDLHSENEISVMAMEKSGQNDWKWPDKKDELVYMLEEVKEIIKEPIKKNTRGVYSVPEMQKYTEYTF